MGATSRPHSFGASAPPPPGARRWIGDNTALRAEQTAPDLITLRYEDLVEAPELSLRRICDFVGIAFHEDMLRHHETPRLWFDVPDMESGTGANGIEHRRLRNWQINQPLFDGRGRWKSLLSEEDLVPFAGGKGRALLSHFGYE